MLRQMHVHLLYIVYNFPSIQIKGLILQFMTVCSELCSVVYKEVKAEGI